jgi:hypothetical protein
MRMPVVGEPVKWHNSLGVEHDALITAVWTETCVNLVVVSKDEAKTDQYGRQIERQTSCSYKNSNQVYGYYWRFSEDEPNPYRPPLQT